MAKPKQLGRSRFWLQPITDMDVQIPDGAVHPGSRAKWRAWLEENHRTADFIWLVRYKKAAGKPDMSYDEAVEEALCFGWIDSKPRKLDEHRAMLYFAPRKQGSGWSRLNKERVLRMEASNRMAPAGQALVDAARADGSWTALDAIENLEVPADLAGAFNTHPPAATHFDAFPRSVKRAILEWIASAKRPETRQKRVEETATLAARNERANQWRKK